MSACDLGCVWAAKSAGLQRGVRPGCGGLTASEGGIETACRAPPPPHQLRLDAGSSIVMGGLAVRTPQPGFGPRKVQWAER